MTLCTRCSRTGHTAGQCPFKRRIGIAAVIATAIMATGCSMTTVIPPPPPNARLMAPPAVIDDPKSGDDLVVAHLKLRKQYYTEVSRFRSLQGYVRVSRGGLK